MQFSLPIIINATYIQWLREVILPLFQKIVEICKYITLPLYYYVSSSMVTLKYQVFKAFGGLFST